MRFPTAEEREAIARNLSIRERKSNQRIHEAAQRIVALSAELHLTMYEYEKAVEKVKHCAVMGVAAEDERW